MSRELIKARLDRLFESWRYLKPVTDPAILAQLESGTPPFVEPDPLQSVFYLGDLNGHLRSDTDEISYVYFSSEDRGASKLMSRGELLRLEAPGDLSRDEAEVLKTLRVNHHFPYPLSIPFSLGDWVRNTVLVLLVAGLPWGVFYLFRWIVYGFIR